MPLTLLNLASWAAAWQAAEAVRDWWLVAATAGLVERVTTFAYLVPTMIGLLRGDRTDQSAATATAIRWVRLGYTRLTATLVAWLAALKALAALGESRA